MARAPEQAIQGDTRASPKTGAPVLGDPPPINGGREAIAAMRKEVDAKLTALHGERYPWWVHWRMLGQYILPRRYHWLVTPNNLARGSPINQAIVDETGTIAARTCASGMMAGITSPAKPWFRMSIPGMDLDEADPIKVWLDQAQEQMMNVFAGSNYYSAKATQYFDLVVFGTAPMIIYEDPDDVIRCYTPCAGEYYAGNSAKLRVDTLYRQFTFTIRQLIDEFGEENVSASVLGSFKTGGAQSTREVIVAHAIEPNDDRLGGNLVSKRFPWREVYWEFGSASHLILRARGFRECPFSCPRWDLAANDAYGRSPGMDALPAIKQLQLEQMRKQQAIDKMVNPPMVASVDLKNQPASMLPGGVTYVSSIAAGASSSGFRPAYEVNPHINEMMEDIKEVQERIKQVFFVDLFLMISQLDTVRTATEIDARREEKLIQLGPVLERFENESLDEDILRVFQIMRRRGLLPPIPKEIAGASVKVEYVSMLAQTQQAASTTAIERVAAFVGNLMGADPTAIDNLDLDEMIDEYADKLGTPPKILRAAAQVAMLRQARQQQQSQQQAMQMAGGAAQGAQVLSQTDVGGGQNALQMMLGNAASGGPQQGAA